MSDTTREILQALDAQNAGLVVGRYPRASYEKPGTAWSCTLRAEQGGVKIEIEAQFGATFDDALAKAWGKFAPAVGGGLPQALIAPPAPRPAAEDADFREV